MPLPQSMKSAFGSHDDPQTEIHEILAFLTAESYIVNDMNEEDFNTRCYLYNRIRKWMVKIRDGISSDILEKVSELIGQPGKGIYFK